jgi:CheY-like chemotaxis protein
LDSSPLGNNATSIQNSNIFILDLISSSKKSKMVPEGMDGKGAYGGHRESRVFDRRVLGRNSQTLDRRLLESQQQHDILFVARPIYTTLAGTYDSIDTIIIPSNPLDTEKLTQDQRTAYIEAQKTVLSKAQAKLSNNQYKVVVTDRPEIARKAAEQRTPFVLIQYNPEQSDESLAERNPHSYLLDPLKSGFTLKFISSMSEVLRSYKQPEPEQETTSVKHTILLVEDEPTNLLLYKQEFQAAGYEVKTAETVEEAFQALDEGNISAVITDLRIPLNNYPHGTAGLHIFQKTQLLYPGTLVIIHTATKSEDVLNTVRDMGVRNIVIKSSDSPQRLIDLVHKALSPKEQKDLALFSDDETMKRVTEKVEGPEEATKRFMDEFDKSQREQKEREIARKST